MKAFEVVADDGRIFYSKLATGSLPAMAALVAQIDQHYARAPAQASAPDDTSEQPQAPHAAPNTNTRSRQVVVHPPTDGALTDEARQLHEKRARRQRAVRILGASVVAAAVVAASVGAFFWKKHHQQPRQEVRINSSTLASHP